MPGTRMLRYDSQISFGVRTPAAPVRGDETLGVRFDGRRCFRETMTSAVSIAALRTDRQLGDSDFCFCLGVVTFIVTRSPRCITLTVLPYAPRLSSVSSPSMKRCFMRSRL